VLNDRSSSDRSAQFNTENSTNIINSPKISSKYWR
jgi:hypothetical protein